MKYNPVANFGTHSLGLEPISEEHTECCRNICPEKLEKHEIEHCLDRSLPYQGWIFLWKWLSHQIASAESSWNNNHHYVIFWQKLKLSENDLILIHSKLQWVKYFLSLMKKKIWKCQLFLKLNLVIVVLARLSTQNLSQVKEKMILYFWK